MSSLQVLATSLPLDTGDLETFHSRAMRVMAARPDWRTIILARPSGEIVVDTNNPLTGPPRRVAEWDSFERVVRSLTPRVGYLAMGPRGEYGVPVRSPVVRDGEMRFVLTAVVKPDAILEVVNSQRVPADWVVSVFDARGMRVARSRGHEKFIGTPAAPSLHELMLTGADEGVGVTHALEGDEVLTAYSRLPQSGWAVAIGIPTSIVGAGVYRSLAAYGGGLVLSLALAMLAALAVARSILRPIGELRHAAHSLGRGELPSTFSSNVREIQEVGDALLASATKRADVEAEREGLLSGERTARAVAEHARARLEMLARAGAMLSQSLQPPATLEAIAAVVVPAVADWCRIDLVDAQGQLQRALTHHSDPQKTQFASELVNRLRATPDTPGSMAWAVATGRSHLVHFDPPAELDRIRDHDLLSFARAIGVRAYFIVPLIARGRTLGALAALQAESGRNFSEDDCALVTQLAPRAALDNARLYAEAEAAVAQAQAANRVKDEFLAVLGHELRNPLAPIVTALHLMARRDEHAMAGERRVIERQVAHLSRLVDDLLDVSRITTGKVQLRRERVDLMSVVSQALELTEPALEQRTQPIEFDLPAQPVHVLGDTTRLVQVLCNLLTNAAKFTARDGRIAVRLRRTGGEVELSVEDAGIGIKAELLPRVFDLFVQGEQPIDRQAGGLGLGLAIVKTLVQMHGGSVIAQSDGPGRGSLFVVRLPEATDAQPGGRSEPLRPPPRSAGRILLVDDNVDAVQTLAMLLRDVGFETRTAADGAKALATLDEFVPDLALLDIGLPGMDGYALASRLRADPRLDDVRLVALTGYGREADRERALAARFDDHLVKPVDPDHLIETIERLLATRRESGLQSGPGD